VNYIPVLKDFLPIHSKRFVALGHVIEIDMAVGMESSLKAIVSILS
jgi:hypothetical protein